MKLHEKIYYCRKKAGYSQEEMADKLGVSRQAVSKWETGEAVPELAKFSAIAKLFNVTTDWLLKDDDSEPEAPETERSESAPRVADEISDGVMSIISKMWRAYGWLIGIIMMIGGAGMFLVASVGMVAFVNMGKTAENMFGMYDGGFGYGGYTDVVGNMTSTVSGVPVVGMVIGALVFAAGLVFFIVHRKKYGKK
jgi:transcriptional regulator with XRE-family HTH domain